jgi:hypothetical protein
LQVRNADTSIKIALTITNAADGPVEGDGAFLSFNRYGGDYFLAQMWDRSRAAGRSIPMSRTEREEAQNASLGKPEVVMVLARR